MDNTRVMPGSPRWEQLWPPEIGSIVSWGDFAPASIGEVRVCDMADPCHAAYYWQVSQRVIAADRNDEPEGGLSYTYTMRAEIISRDAYAY